LTAEEQVASQEGLSLMDVICIFPSVAKQYRFTNWETLNLLTAHSKIFLINKLHSTERTWQFDC